MLKSEELTLNVSQEFFKDGAFTSNISQFTDKLRGFFTAAENDENFIGGNQVPNARKLHKLASKKNYADTRELSVRVPTGLSCTYLDYLAVLQDAVKLTDNLMDHVLVPFTRYLAVGLSDPDTLASSGSSVHLKEFKPGNVDGVALKLGECFEQGSGHFERKFGAVFERNGDVGEVYNQADELVSRFMKVRRSDVQSKVNELSDLLDKLIQRIEEDEENYKPSKVTTDQLSKISYTIAQEVEFYGVVGYQLMALTVALQETEDTLKKMK